MYQTINEMIEISYSLKIFKNTTDSKVENNVVLCIVSFTISLLLHIITSAKLLIFKI